MSEKKIRRDISVFKASEWFCAIIMFVCFGFALHFDSLSTADKPQQWKFEVWILSLFSCGLGVGFIILSFVCLVLRRSAEYTLFLKEAFETHKKGATADVGR